MSPAFAAIIFRLIGREASQVADVGKTLSRAQQLSPAPEPTLEEWERRVEAKILDDRSLRDTEREALVQARRGQGVFRTNVQTIERACRVTKVEQREHLIASHVKPWRDSSNDERLNGENGLLAEKPTEWRNALAHLLDSPERRRDVGEAASADVRLRHTTKVVAKHYYETIAELARELCDFSKQLQG